MSSAPPAKQRTLGAWKSSLLGGLLIAFWLVAWRHFPPQKPPYPVAYWAEVSGIILLGLWLLSLLRLRRRDPQIRFGWTPFILFYGALWVWLTTATNCGLVVDALALSFFVLGIVAVLVSLTRRATEQAQAAEVLAKREGDLTAQADSLEQANQDLQQAQKQLAWRNDELAGFAEVARICASSLNVDTLADKVAEGAVTLAGADFAAVYLSTDQGEFVLNAHRHASPTWLAHAECLHGKEGALARVANASKAEAFVVSPTRDDEELLAEPGPKTLTLVPLLAPGRVEGVLLLGRAGERYTKPDVEFWGSLGSHIGISLQNARLYWQAARAWQDLVAAQGQLIRAERFAARGELADGVAHDFNNILACVLANCQLLLRDCEDERAKHRLQLMEQAARDGAETVQRLQRFASEEHADRGPVDLVALLEDVAELTRHRWKDEAEAHGQHIGLQRDFEEVPTIEANPAELREAFTNLVLNAIDAVPRGGTVTLRTRQEQAHVCAEVSDDGVGMPPEVAARAFEPFFTTKRQRGTGLGLAVVSGIVSRHGGSVSIHTKPGEGTCVSVRLPLSRPPTPPQSLTPEPTEAPAISGRILLVEDEEGVREPIAEALRQAGHSVVEAASGQKAIAHLESERFDMVISDLGMPKVSGWQVVETAKLQDPAVVTALLTGWAQILNPAEARQRHADFILAKPIDLRRLTAEVQERLSAARRSSPQKEG